MRIASRGIIGVCAMLAACAACAAPHKTTAASSAPPAHGHAHNPGDHNHARGKMLMASDGTYNALLTAHLSAKDGNELDIFVEDKDGPKALATTTLEAVARVGQAAEARTLSFECAPANERPANEAQGTCSHFVTKAPWLRVGETIRVDTALPIGASKVAMVWRDFEAKKYAHHEE